MAAPELTPAQRYALLAARGLDSWPTILSPEQAAALQRPAHVNVEANYRRVHHEAANFEGLRIDTHGPPAPLHADVRYRVEGLLTPGYPDGACVGYNGPTLRPFVVEALTRGRIVEHAGLRIRAYRSPGWLRVDGHGDYLEPRQSRLDVLTGQTDDTVYIAVIRAFCRASEASYIHYPCRTAWRGLFAANPTPSLFWHMGGLTDEPSPPVQLPRDPAEGVLAVREHLLAGIHRRPNSCGVDGVIMAFAGGTMHCLRMGDHRVLRRTGTTTDTVLWEHTVHRYPPDPPPAEIPSWIGRILQSSLAPGPPPCPIHSTPSAPADRWLIVSGGLLSHLVGQLSDETIADALGQGTPDDLAAWLAATAARFPDDHNPTTLPEWGLVVVDTADAPGPPHTSPPQPLDPTALLAQLHELEKQRT
jgi:hypothetical protein